MLARELVQQLILTGFEPNPKSDSAGSPNYISHLQFHIVQGAVPGFSFEGQLSLWNKPFSQASASHSL
jgi:hypothetical protein